MAEIGVFDGERKKWIPFDEDTEVLVKLVTKEELRAIANKSAKMGQKSAEAADKLLGRAAVLGWRKFDDPTHPGLVVGGQPLEFTPENIDMLMTRSIEFSRFVNEYAVNEKAFIGDAKNG